MTVAGKSDTGKVWQPAALARVLALALLAGSASLSLAQLPQPPKEGESHGLSPRQAVELARERHEGKVLRVQRKGKAFKVRMLLPDGRVITVTIKD